MLSPSHFTQQCSTWSFLAHTSSYWQQILAPLLTEVHQDLIKNAWILDFLDVMVTNFTLSTLILNTGVPQGCVLSPFHSVHTGLQNHPSLRRRGKVC